MPTRMDLDDEDGSEEETTTTTTATRQNQRPSRKAAREVNYAPQPPLFAPVESLLDTDDDTEEDGNPKLSSSEEDDGGPRPNRRKGHTVSQPSSRKSSRSTKFTGSMNVEVPMGNYSDDGTTASEEEPDRPRPRRESMKSPAKQHTRARKVFHSPVHTHHNDDDDSLEEEDVTDEEDDDDDEEPVKIQRILATRALQRKDWKELCQNMNTSEIDHGSRWFQQCDENSDDEVFEERFLVKWSEFSYLHCSWETQEDLIDQVENAKNYLSTFFRKSVNGYLYSPEERNDGDYFDPAFVQIDRILEIVEPDDAPMSTYEDEDKRKPEDFGVILDRKDPNYEDGTGRQFLVKWGNTPYSASTYEFERDLIVNDIDYKDELKDFLRRSRKPSTKEANESKKKAKTEFRRLYKTFGEKYQISEEANNRLSKEFQEELMTQEYKNGGNLRDYQAEGVAWIMSNYVNDRSSILADEMGLGKTLQTVSSLNYISTKLKGESAFLIVAPLSTLTHWYREFKSWTNLNTIIYHGSAEDRRVLRELEMAYAEDRPKNSLSLNYLQKCQTRGQGQAWMVDVLITTPEIMVAADAGELASVEWDVLVVDEAHRLKNHNSKLAETLRSSKFTFHHRILLTGTPIQNDVKEFWTLLHFIDPESFASSRVFLEKYGDMKDKETIDELHEEIRPYILRRLKEDVEKSVPPKEETLVEVELTLEQKQYYRALYEKNVKFLHKNKKGLDGPSLNNLAMQLRKCCNHLFLLNGVEEEIRSKMPEGLGEGDILARSSGKLVLLDKLLPRLKELGHRILVFSQFKIMLDILEDYLNARQYKFERIDGSITGLKRQQAIDRFQADSSTDGEAPFIMLLSTRAGGVGINLTAADTCIIFDSDWNPQNDLQAQARCHRIGQTKTVKVYRLLTRKTYELQMYHMSSLKMGLDQAVLTGFENNSSGEGSLSKAEVEKLLRHGAYDILNEEKAGKSEAESNEYAQQDIDSILQLHSRTVVHENTGSKSNASGGTFAKARFRATKTPSKGESSAEDVDIEDPDFWKKMVGATEKEEDERIVHGQRIRRQQNYSEKAQWEAMEVEYSDVESEKNDDSDEEDDDIERSRWGGNGPTEWRKEDAEALQKHLGRYGYCLHPSSKFEVFHGIKTYPEDEINRMAFSLVLYTFLEEAKAEVILQKRREEKANEKKDNNEGIEGGCLALAGPDKTSEEVNDEALLEDKFKMLIDANKFTLQKSLEQAVRYASMNEPRDQGVIDRALDKKTTSSTTSSDAMFAQNVWPPLRSRGWKAVVVTDSSGVCTTRYSINGREMNSIDEVLNQALVMHPELGQVIQTVADSFEDSRKRSRAFLDLERQQHLAMSTESVSYAVLEAFLTKYAPLQLVVGREKKSATAFRFPRRTMTNTSALLDTSMLALPSKREGNIDLEFLSNLVKSRNPSAAPCKDWTYYHDSVLIHGILRHGWIDSDDAYNAILGDKMLQWGPPFVSEEKAPDNSVSVSRVIDLTLSTASRAAKLLNERRNLQNLNGFLSPSFLDTLKLQQIDTSAFSASPDSEPLNLWRVNEEELSSSLREQLSSKPAISFPSKRDCLKRMKSILAKTGTTPSASNVSSNKDEQNDSVDHQYSTLDKSPRYNALLEHLLRVAVKAPSQGKESKELLVLARQEAEARIKDESDPKSAADLENIVKHIDLVRRNLTKAARQSKNVLRAVLGEKPQLPFGKKSSEGVYLPEAPPLRLKTISNTKPIPKKDPPENGKAHLDPLMEKKPKPSQAKPKEVSYGSELLRTTGEMAIAKAEDTSSTNTTTSLRLTGIEWALLKVLTSRGIPPTSGRTQESGDWKTLASAVAKVCLDSTSTANSILQQKQKMLREAKLDPSINIDLIETEDQILEARRHIDRCSQDVEHAREYMNDPAIFSKKTIMMLAKMFEVGSSANPVQGENEVGSKVFEWLGKEIVAWATLLALLDDSGNPHAYTAVDFIDSEEDLEGVHIQGCVTPDGCRAILSQMSMLSRARFFLEKYNNDDMQGRLELAAEYLSERSEQSGFRMPNWWRSAEFLSSAHHDLLLLKRLVVSGFDGVQRDQNTFGIALVTDAQSFKQRRIPNGALQIRANQLVRQLHVIEESDRPIPKAARAPALKFPEKKGLHAFFSAASSSQEKRKSEKVVIDLALDDSEDSSPEKKQRLS